MRSLAAIYLGRPAVLLPIFEPGAALDAIERFRCAYTFGLPALLQFVVEEQLQEARDTTSLRTVIAGGDCVPVKLQERFADIFGVRLHEGIGMSETYPIAFNRKGAIRLGSLGVPSPGVELSFEDADDRMLEDGEIGEIVVQSPANCIGYWNDSVATEALLRSGWLHTGDLGTRDNDGYVWFKGRKKEIVVHAAPTSLYDSDNNPTASFLNVDNLMINGCHQGICCRPAREHRDATAVMSGRRATGWMHALRFIQDLCTDEPLGQERGAGPGV